MQKEILEACSWERKGAESRESILLPCPEGCSGTQQLAGKAGDNSSVDFIGHLNDGGEGECGSEQATVGLVSSLADPTGCNSAFPLQLSFI